MQFKHPEILWALLLLIIPIIIHLFQLRRFKKTPFTNIAMLQKVVSESRKSNSLKKWLLLLTRMLLLAALIIAFAQPFFAKKSALKKKELVIYLDDSFSMQAQKDGLPLLELAVQDLIKTIPDNTTFSLFTNTRTLKDVELKSVQNKLLSLEYTGKQLTFNEVLLKSKTLFSDDLSTQKNLIVISDFQERLGAIEVDTTKKIVSSLVDLKPDTQSNLAIDSVYLKDNTRDQIELNIVVSGIQEEESIPISIFNGNTLVAKTAVDYAIGAKTLTTVSLPKNETIKGRVSLTDNSLSYDNDFYFSIDKKEKIKVLAISETDADFLNRIFTDDEFEFQNFETKELNYAEIDTQNLVLLNGLSSIPTSLQTVLNSFQKKGGNIVIIPALDIDINSYNSFIYNLTPIQLVDKTTQEQKITAIAFDHPLYKNVFEKKVANFDYPQVKSFWNVNTKNSKILSLASGAPFLITGTNLYFFTAALTKENSNFKNSPLIVPTFYNMGVSSLKLSRLYLTIGDNATIEISKKIEKDKVITALKADSEFIPLQQAYANKVSLSFNDNPKEDGIYSLMNANDTLKNIGFNFNRKESALRYTSLDDINSDQVQKNIPQVFQKLAKDNSIIEYWKWFVIFALVFALVEALIQKFLA